MVSSREVGSKVLRMHGHSVKNGKENVRNFRWLKIDINISWREHCTINAYPWASRKCNGSVIVPCKYNNCGKFCAYSNWNRCTSNLQHLIRMHGHSVENGNIALGILDGFSLVWVLMYGHSKCVFLQVTFKFWIRLNEYQ